MEFIAGRLTKDEQNQFRAELSKFLTDTGMSYTQAGVLFSVHPASITRWFKNEGDGRRVPSPNVARRVFRGIEKLNAKHRESKLFFEVVKLKGRERIAKLREVLEAESD